MPGRCPPGSASEQDSAGTGQHVSPSCLPESTCAPSQADLRQAHLLDPTSLFICASHRHLHLSMPQIELNASSSSSPQTGHPQCSVLSNDSHGYSWLHPQPIFYIFYIYDYIYILLWNCPLNLFFASILYHLTYIIVLSSHLFLPFSHSKLCTTCTVSFLKCSDCFSGVSGAYEWNWEALYYEI